MRAALTITAATSFPCISMVMILMEVGVDMAASFGIVLSVKMRPHVMLGLRVTNERANAPRSKQGDGDDQQNRTQDPHKRYDSGSKRPVQGRVLLRIRSRSPAATKL